jgi:hypothetical protein
MVKQAGYGSAKMNRTFDIYDHVDDCHYMNIHDLIMFQKHGHWKACRKAFANDNGYRVAARALIRIP